MPRSTYHAIRVRMMENGWLEERYLPDPRATGFTSATFVLGRPFTERAGQAASQITKGGQCPVLWRGPQSIFAVTFNSSVNAAENAIKELKESPAFSSLYSLTCDVSPSSVPAYFDFEGLWAHVMGLAGTTAYPAPLGNPGSSTSRLTELERKEMEPLVSADKFSRGFFGLSRRSRRVLEKGLVSMRVFLSPWTMPSYDNHTMDNAVFVHGNLRKGSHTDLFGLLAGECKVNPFLYASDGKSVLICAMGQAHPVEPSTSGKRRSVVATIEEHLQDIETIVEPLVSQTVVINHRYEMLLSPRR